MTPEEKTHARMQARGMLRQRRHMERKAIEEAERWARSAQRWARVERAFAAPFSMEKWRRV